MILRVMDDFSQDLETQNFFQTIKHASQFGV